jgi:hypothetical protein
MKYPSSSFTIVLVIIMVMIGCDVWIGVILREYSLASLHGRGWFETDLGRASSILHESFTIKCKANLFDAIIESFENRRDFQRVQVGRFHNPVKASHFSFSR